MTKAEAFVYNSPKWTRLDPTFYTLLSDRRVQVNRYRHESGMILECDSYMGFSHLTHENGFRREIESVYDTALKELV